MSRKGIVYFVGLCIVWGLPYLLIKIAIREVTPGYLVLVRTAGGALILGPIAARSGQLRAALPYWRQIIAYSMVEICLPWYILFNSERHITSSLAALMVAAVPLAATVISAVAGTEGVDLRRGSGLLIGVSGVGLLVGFNVAGSQLGAALSLIVIIIGYALGPWLVANFLKGVPPIGLAAWSFILTVVIYLPFGFLQWPSANLSFSVISSIAGLTVLCTVAAFLLLFALVRQVGPVRATLVTYVNPAVAVFLGATVLNEAIHPSTVVGFVLLLIGCYLAGRPPTGRQLRRRRKNSSQRAEEIGSTPSLD